MYYANFRLARSGRLEVSISEIIRAKADDIAS
jgi:hypothetical protein